MLLPFVFPYVITNLPIKIVEGRSLLIQHKYTVVASVLKEYIHLLRLQSVDPRRAISFSLNRRVVNQGG